MLPWSENNKLIINKKDKTIQLSQNHLDDRFLLKNGDLNGWNIVFNGIFGSNLTKQRFDKNLITGCLTFIDMKINNVNIEIVWEPVWTMDKMTEEGKLKIKEMGAAGVNTPAPINYETALPQGVGKLVQQEDGSMVLANEHEQGFMVNKAIVDFWKSCTGQRKVTDLVEVFAQQTGLQRNQVEKEVMQLLQQLRDGGLIAIAGHPDTPNVEFKK